TLAGRASGLKEVTVAVEALGRTGSFDPDADPIVRVQARRLRQNWNSTTSVKGRQMLSKSCFPKEVMFPSSSNRKPEPLILPQPGDGSLRMLRQESPDSLPPLGSLLAGPPTRYRTDIIPSRFFRLRISRVTRPRSISPMGLRMSSLARSPRSIAFES